MLSYFWTNGHMICAKGRGSITLSRPRYKRLIALYLFSYVLFTISTNMSVTFSSDCTGIISRLPWKK